MKQTSKYQLNLIETGDRFSPDPINENTQALEDALADHLADSTAHGDAGTALQNHAGSKNNPHGVTAAQVGAAAASHNHGAANITSGVLAVARGGTGNTAVDTVPTSGSTKMVTSGGIFSALASKLDLNSLPWVIGTYTGTGVVGTAQEITVGFQPSLLFICGGVNSECLWGMLIRHGSTTNSISTTRGGTDYGNAQTGGKITATATGFTVIKHESYYDRTLNESGKTYLYIAFR